MNSLFVMQVVQSAITQTGTQPSKVFIRESPIRSIVRQNQESGAGPLVRRELPLGLIGIILGVAVCMGVLAWWINRRAARRPSVEARAFVRLAKKLRLGRASRGLVEQLATKVGTPPVALLASPGVLRVALDQVDKGAWSTRPGWKRLEAVVGERA